MPKDPNWKSAKQKRSEKARLERSNQGLAERVMDAHETASDYAVDGKTMPKSFMDFRKITAWISKSAEDDWKRLHPGEPIPKGIAIAPLMVYEGLMKIATRESVESIDQVKCPSCKENHDIVCSKCGVVHSIKMPHPHLEKNQMSALLKLSDKYAPNRAAVTHDINVNVIVMNINDLMAQFILKYVPSDERVNVLSQFRTKMLEVSSSEESS